MNSHTNPALDDLRDDDSWTVSGLPMRAMWERVDDQLTYFESDFGYEALNDGIYTPEQIAAALPVLRRLTS